MDVHVND